MDKEQTAGAQLARVVHMQALYDEIEAILASGENCPERLKQQIGALQELRDYCEGQDWLADYDADEVGMFPTGLRRGILTEDALYDLLADADEALRGV